MLKERFSPLQQDYSLRATSSVTLFSFNSSSPPIGAATTSPSTTTCVRGESDFTDALKYGDELLRTNQNNSCAVGCCCQIHAHAPQNKPKVEGFSRILLPVFIKRYDSCLFSVTITITTLGCGRRVTPITVKC